MSTRVFSRTGTEGPRHDPYGYTELQVRNERGSFVLHEGLAVWVEVRLRNAKPVRFETPRFTQEEIEEIFTVAAGMSPETARRCLRRLASAPLRAHNARCGSRAFECAGGMPGESLTVCRACGAVVEYDFDEGAVR